jgi:hypothetical protein
VHRLLPSFEARRRRRAPQDDDNYLAEFSKVSLCACLERHDLISPCRAKNSFDAIARVFKAITNIGDSLPIDTVPAGL